MTKKISPLIVVFSIAVIATIISIVYFIHFNNLIRARKTFENTANIQFSKLVGFKADFKCVYDNGESTGTVLYKFPNKYRSFNNNEGTAWNLLDKDGAYWYYDINRFGAKGIYKVDTQKLNPAQKKEFYKGLPPLQEFLYSSLEGTPVSQGKDEIINGRITAHYSALRRTHILFSIDFWVDKETGIIVKYEDRLGTKWQLANIQTKVDLKDAEFVYSPPLDLEIYDGTGFFLNNGK